MSPLKYYISAFLETTLIPVFTTTTHEAASGTISDLMVPGCGSILCTSRHADVGRLGTELNVGNLSEVEGLDLLLYRSHHNRTDDNIKEGTAIIQKLGCLALAIDQAAACINFRHLPLMHFMDHYERREKVVLNHTPESLWEYRRTLGAAKDQTSLNSFTTWEMSFQQIAQDDNEKRNIGHFLTLAAFLNPAKITEDLFEIYFTKASPKPKWMEGFCTNGDWDSDVYQDTICGLFNLSLIQNMEATGTQTSFSLHPLIRDWLQLRRDPEDHQRCSTEVLQLLAAFVDIDRKDFLTHSVFLDASSHIRFWLESEEVIPQSHSAEPPEGWRDEYPVIPRSVSVLVLFYVRNDQPKHELAERLALRNLDGCGEYLGQNHPCTIVALESLALLYKAQGRYLEAKAMYYKALGVSEVTNDSHYRAKIMHVQADLSKIQGDYNTAAQELLFIFKTKLSTHGDSSPATIVAAIDAGRSYHKAQDFVAAAILMEAAAWVLGESPFKDLYRLTYLGDYYMSRNKLVESEKWFTLGLQDNLVKPISLKGLARICIKTGSDEEAEDYLQQAKKGYEMFLGPLNQETLQAIETLGLFYWRTGKLEVAMAYLEEAAEGYRQSFGPLHEFTAYCTSLLSELQTVIGHGHGTGDLPFEVRELFELEDLSSSIIDQPGWDPLHYEYTPVQIELLEWAGRILNHEASTREGVQAESVNGESGVTEAMGEPRISNTTDCPREIQGLDSAETPNGQKPHGSEVLSGHLLIAYRLLSPVPGSR